MKGMTEVEWADTAHDVLMRLGLEPTQENAEHLAVFAQALGVYEERSASYGSVWRQYGARSNLLSAARKVDRLMEYWWFNPDGAKALAKSTLDDAIDGINYLTFFIRNATSANLDGTPAERPLTIAQVLNEAQRP